MRKANCEVIRQELDELTLDDTGSAAAVAHLRDCVACRDFNEKQTRLRQIVGSLGTVSAPPDFDFRLRARLANDANSGGFHFWTLARRGLAFAVVVFVFVMGAILIRNVFDRPAKNNQVATIDKQSPAPAPQPDRTVEAQEVSKPAPQFTASSSTPEKRPQTIKNDRSSSTASRVRRPLVAEDFSSVGAGVINGRRETAGAFEVLPTDASLQSFKVSLDDGRGNAHTISVPSISFGSQRMLQTGNSFAAKRVW